MIFNVHVDGTLRQVQRNYRRDASMPKEFRAYLLDQNDHIVKAHDLQAEDDAAASNAALDLAKDGDVEVWDGSRLVVRIPKIK